MPPPPHAACGIKLFPLCSCTVHKYVPPHTKSLSSRFAWLLQCISHDKIPSYAYNDHSWCSTVANNYVVHKNKIETCRNISFCSAKITVDIIKPMIYSESWLGTKNKQCRNSTFIGMDIIVKKLKFFHVARFGYSFLFHQTAWQLHTINYSYFGAWV